MALLMQQKFWPKSPFSLMIKYILPFWKTQRTKKRKKKSKFSKREICKKKKKMT